MSDSPMPPWEPACNGAGKRPWFLIRGEHTLPVRDRYHYDRRGDLIRYASYETALRAATWLNKTAAAEDNCAHVRYLLAQCGQTGYDTEIMAPCGPGCRA